MLPSDRWRRATGAGCRRHADVSTDHTARRQGIFPEAGLSEGTLLTPAALRAGFPVPAAPLPAGLIDPGAPPPTAPAGGPPPTLPAGAPPPTAALPMPAAPAPPPVAPVPALLPPEPAPPPAPGAKPVGNATINKAKAKLLGLKTVIICSIVEASTEPGLPGSKKQETERNGRRLKNSLTTFANTFDLPIDLTVLGFNLGGAVLVRGNCRSGGAGRARAVGSGCPV